MDESNADAYHRDQNEYEQYEEIEKVIEARGEEIRIW